MKLKILIATNIIELNTVRKLKEQFKITYNTHDTTADIKIDDKFISLIKYPEYKFEYTQYMLSPKSKDISFIMEQAKNAYLELSSMNF